MRTITHLLHQKGMTLVEVMIAVALLGGVSLLTAKLMTDQANNQNFIKAKAEMAATVSRIELVMSDPVKCKAMLDKSTINANGVSASSLVALGASATALDANVLKYPIIRNGSVAGSGSCSSSCDCPNMYDVCESGSCVDRTTGCINGTLARGDNFCQYKCNGGWTCPATPQICPTGSAASALYAFVLGEADYGLFSIPNKGIYLQDSAYGSAITELVIVFNMTGKKGYFGSDIATNRRPVYTKKIPFVSQRYKTGTDAGKLQSCGAVLENAMQTAQEKMCKSLGADAAYWDTATNPPSCRLYPKVCPVNQVPGKMEYLGKFNCQDFATQVNLTELFDTTPVDCLNKPNLQIVSVPSGTGFKLKVKCN